MRLFENDPRSGLERCIEDSDIRYSTCPEALAIWDPSGDLLDDCRNEIVRTADGCLIKFADEEYIGLYENLLEVHYSGKRTLDMRRGTAAAYFIQQYHIGEPEIRETFQAYGADTVNVRLDGGCVVIDVTIDYERGLNAEDAVRTLRKWIPTHLGILAEVLIYHECKGHVHVTWGAGFCAAYAGTSALVEHSASRHFHNIGAAFQNSHFGGHMVPASHGYTTDHPITTAAMVRVSHTSRIISEEDN